MFAGAPALLAADKGDTLDWLKAPALRPGDTIAFVAPSGPADLAPLLAYKKQLEKNGYRVVIPQRIDRKSGYLAGTDDERSGELNTMIRDPRIRGIFPARGGYGLTRILDRIDYDALRKGPKIITGYSDLTALHLAIARKAKVITFHSPTPMRDLWKGDQQPFGFAAKSFARAVFAEQYKKGQNGYMVDVPEDARPVRLVGGLARGRLLGGNLSLICATLGTPYAMEPKGAILLVEDTNEASYRVDRFFSQLRLAGVLDTVAGVVVGNFSVKDAGDAKEIDRVLREYLGALKVPVILNFPVGHIARNATLPHGGLVELDADKVVLRVLENPVQVN